MRPNWFIALPVVPDRWFTERIPPPPPGVRQLAAEDLHVTVAFLGAVSPDLALAAWDLAHCETETVAATLGDVVPMGRDRRRPTALSALLEAGRDEACAIIDSLRAPLLAAAGARPDNRSPKPHLTLARPRRRATDRQRDRGLAWAAALDLKGLPIVIDHLALYTWSPERRARMFEIVEQRPLGRRGVAFVPPVVR